MPKRINVAVIGCGYWGPNLVRNFSQLEKVDVKYVCDKDKERLKWIKSLYPRIRTETKAQKVINDPQVEAVAIATPASTHYSLARRCLERNKHVLVEKPLAIDFREAISLVKLARDKKRIVMVGHTYLFAPGIRKLQEIIIKKQLGKVLYVNSQRVNLGLLQKDINVILDLGPHDISIMNYLLGLNPQAVSATGSSHYHKGIEDVSFLTLYYAGGLMAHIHLSWIDPLKIRRITVVGSKEMAVYDDLNTEEPLKIFQKSIDKIPYYKNYAEFKMIYRFGDVISPQINNQEPLSLECQHFLDCVLKGNTPLTSAESALEVVKIIEAANKSLKNKGKIVELK